MKKSVITLMMVGATLGVMAQTERSFQDTVTVNVGDSLIIKLIPRDRKVLHEINNLDYNFLKEVTTIADSANRAESPAESGDSKRIKTYDITLPGKTLVVTSHYSGDNDEASAISGKSYGTASIAPKKRKKRTSFEGSLDLGLNNYLGKSGIPESNSGYSLYPLGSRHAAINLMEKTRVGSDKSPIYLYWGAAIDWNNFMFNDNVTAAKDSMGNLYFPVAEGISYAKSKLATSYLSIPVIPMIDFGPAKKNGFRFGIGGYAGYRLKTWTKTVHYEDSDKKKNKATDNFNMNDFRYGVIAVIGVEDIVDVFFKYDLNPLFQPGKGPELNTISFGIRL